MDRYLIIESRDPFETSPEAMSYDLAVGLSRAGSSVSVFLVQNGVLPARRSRESERLAALLAAGVAVVAEAFSLRERGISHAELAPGIRPAALDEIIHALASGARVMWH